MGTLNRSKHFGIVYGIAPWSFEQAGKYFNHEGVEVDKTGKLIEPPPKPAQQADPVGETHDAALGDLGPPVAGPGPEIEGEPEIENEAIIDTYGNREEIIMKLEEMGIPYNPKSRRSKLLELLKGKE